MVVFDPMRIRDASTFDDPNHYSEGITHVFVHGKSAVSAGRISNERAGQVLRGRGWRQKPGAP